MAYNVNQLQQLQDMIGVEADVPNAIDRYNAMKLLKQAQTGVRREEGGQLDLADEAQEIASKGRYGDTMLMHVTPDEVHGLSSLRGGVTINPETGLPEAFLDPITMALIGAAIGGVGSAATGGDPLKGAAFGAIGGLMPAAFGAGAGALGLGPAWAGLGAIGQGMMIGGAMGGVRSLFGDSDNPLRDIMLGAAMGGAGGALFGEVPATDATVDVGGTMYQPEVPSVLPSGVTTGQVAQTPIGYTANVQALRGGVTPQVVSEGFAPGYIAGPRIAPLSTAQALKAAQPIGIGGSVPTDISSQVIRSPITAPATQEWVPGGGPKYVRMGEDLGAKVGLGSEAPWYTPRDLTPEVTTAVEEATAAQNIAGDDAAKTGLGAWWDRQGKLTKAGIIGGTGLLAASAFGKPQQQDIEGLTVGQTAFEPLEPKQLQEPIQPLTEEQILAAYSGPSGTGIDTWFQTAKDGGLLSVVKRQYGAVIRAPGPLLAGPGGQQPPSGFTYVPGVGPQGMSVLKPISEVGGTYAQPQHYQKAVLTPGGGGGGAPAPAPEVTDPFVSNLSSFNVQDALARITGQSAVPEQITLPTAAQLPALATSSQLPAGNIQQGASALSDLFSRFQQAQGDPIVDIVSSTGAIPETVSTKDGGLVELDDGGTIINNKNSDIPKYWIGTGATATGLGSFGLGVTGGGQSGGPGGSSAGTAPQAPAPTPTPTTTTYNRAGPQVSNAPAPTTMTIGPPSGQVTSGQEGGLGTQGMGFMLSPGIAKGPFGNFGEGDGNVGYLAATQVGPLSDAGQKAQSFTTANYAKGPMVAGTGKSTAAVHAPGLAHTQMGVMSPSFGGNVAYGAPTTTSALKSAIDGIMSKLGSPGPDASFGEKVLGLLSLTSVPGMLGRFAGDAYAMSKNVGWSPGMLAQAEANAAADAATTGRQGSADDDDPYQEDNPYYVRNPILEEGPMATGSSAFINQGGPVGLAAGGVFEGRVQGHGDGMADQVAFNVVPQTPADIPNTPDMALLSSDEYVVPADVVSMLGNGSSTAGAQSLDKFNQLMRRKAHGTNSQQKELNAGKELSRLV